MGWLHLQDDLPRCLLLHRGEYPIYQLLFPEALYLYTIRVARRFAGPYSEAIMARFVGRKTQCIWYEILAVIVLVLLVILVLELTETTHIFT